MESFSTIRFEVLISSVWTNLTPDVRQTPPPRVSGMGIMGNNIMDRVGDVGTLEFSLDNSATNSATTLGYYTPEGANRLTGWMPGLPVRLYFEYDGFRRYKFYGHINPDGLTPTTGQFGELSVSVKASNWMREASIHTLDLMGYQTNKTMDEGIDYVIGNMRTEPLQVNYLYAEDAGVANDDTIIFPTIFDVTRTNTKAMGEISKFVMSNLAFAYVRGDGSGGETFETQSRIYRGGYVGNNTTGTQIPVKQSAATDNLLLESGDDLLLEDGFFLLLEQSEAANFTEAEYESMEVSYGKNMANRVTLVTYPRSVDAAATTVLYELEEPIFIEAGETLSNVRGKFRDPNNQATKVNGIEMVTPVATTDYQMWQNEDGTGTDYVSSLGIITEFGTAEVKFKLTNNAVADAYITRLQVRGKGVYIYDTSEKVFDAPDALNNSQNIYGVIPLSIDLPYLDKISQLTYATPEDAIYSNGLLVDVDYPLLSIDKIIMTANTTSKQMMAFMFLEPGTLMKVSSTVLSDGGAGNDYFLSPWFIQGYDFEIIDGAIVKTSYVMRNATQNI